MPANDEHRAPGGDAATRPRGARHELPPSQVTMQVRINRLECCGNGVCVEVAPDVFALDSKHKAIVLDADAASEAVVREAAETCPCQAIVVMDDQGNPVFP